MKRYLAVILAALMLVGSFALAEDMDLSSFTDAELDGLEMAIQAEREARAQETADEEPALEGTEAEESVPESTAAEESVFVPLQKGVWSESNRVLQEKLRELGFAAGAADGIFGAKTENALKALQKAVGWEETGIVESQEKLDEILKLVAGDGVNLVRDGRFADPSLFWNPWGEPALREIVEEDGKTWMHLVSSDKWQGYQQNKVKRGVDPSTVELTAGERYTLSFLAYGSEDSIGKQFTCGIHNNNLTDGAIQEQYWSPRFELTESPQTYIFTFLCNVDGAFNVMIGAGLEENIEAWFTDVQLEKGDIASAWHEFSEE